jgi:SAM-dependent methyltransferase
MAAETFDTFSEVYEALVDWPKRLANEGPFFRAWFERCGAAMVLDAACGTGQHAALFADWGLSVEGADQSPAMIQRARAAHGESNTLRWIVRSFEESVAEGSFDAVVCVGNSLALARDVPSAQRAISRFVSAVRDGGVVIVHLLNLWRLPDGPCVWQKSQRTRLARGDTLIVKGVHRAGNRGYVDLVVVTLNGSAALQTESAPLLGLEAAQLAEFARQAGAPAVELFGDYRSQPYERLKSADLIMVARKGRGLWVVG